MTTNDDTSRGVGMTAMGVTARYRKRALMHKRGRVLTAVTPAGVATIAVVGSVCVKRGKYFLRCSKV